MINKNYPLLGEHASKVYDSLFYSDLPLDYNEEYDVD